LRHLTHWTGLTRLSRALSSPRMLVHGRAGPGWPAIADGARVISDFRVMSDQRDLFGIVANADGMADTDARSQAPGQLAKAIYVLQTREIAG